MKTPKNYSSLMNRQLRPSFYSPTNPNVKNYFRDLKLFNHCLFYLSSTVTMLVSNLPNLCGKRSFGPIFLFITKSLWYKDYRILKNTKVQIFWIESFGTSIKTQANYISCLLSFHSYLIQFIKHGYKIFVQNFISYKRFSW